MLKIKSFAELEQIRGEAKIKREIRTGVREDQPALFFSVAPGCQAQGALEIMAAFENELAKNGLADKYNVYEIPRIGNPKEFGPDMLVFPGNVHYGNLTIDDVPWIVEEHLLKGNVVKDKQVFMRVVADTELKDPEPKEVRNILGRCGKINPENIEDYILEDGYTALCTVLTSMSDTDVIQTIKEAGLRGRGGAGFPTGIKWELAHNNQSDQKFVICNADEGDPGAFMNRRVLESDPHAVLEGMIIAAYAIGASEGYVYCRAEYPTAVQRFRIAIEQAHQIGLLGENIFGTGFKFDLELRMGAGAFVCGEETALIASIEGERGEPRPRPPFPAQKGLWGQPSNINNVETYANVPRIILNGPEWFQSMGSDTSKGTKTFALAADLENTGLIEVPLGTTLREIIFDVGKGIKDGKGFKAVQAGGPAGGCLVEQHLDLPIDYESLRAAGAMMGSGGLIVMDDETCMVDIARFFMEFTQEESCGKCIPCRVGTRKILDILERICAGEGLPDDIETLETLCAEVKQNSLCGLGQGAPNPVVTTLKYFREEYEAHIFDKKCPAKTCRSMITFTILEDACTGCTLCAINCPVNAITGERKKLHVIDEDICIRCGICEQVCNFDAVKVF